MLTLPKIVERAAQSYVAVTEKVTVPFGEVIGGAMGQVAGYLEAQGVKQFGPAIFKYDLIDMPRLGIEFGLIVDKPPSGDGKVQPATLPAGKYATVTYFGHYDDLQEVTGVLIDWARGRGIRWDSTDAREGEAFASRFELYPNGPMDEPDPLKWETQIFIKTKD